MEKEKRKRLPVEGSDCKVVANAWANVEHSDHTLKCSGSNWLLYHFALSPTTVGSKTPARKHNFA